MSNVPSYERERAVRCECDQTPLYAQIEKKINEMH
jgi:hypothetical protein